MAREKVMIGEGDEAREVEVVRPWEARQSMLDEIDAANDAEKAADGMVEIMDDGTTAPIEDESSPPATESEVLDGYTETEETSRSEPTAKRKMRLKVNGEERELTEDQVIALAQKVASADEYLRIAKEAAAVSRPPVQEPAPSYSDVLEGPSEEDLQLAQALQVGSTEEAAAAIHALRGRSPSPDVISSQVEDRIAYKQARDWAQETFTDVFEDPITARLFIAVDQDLLATGDRRPYRDRYKAIGEHIRTWKGGVKPATNQDPALTDKERRKATVQVIPTAGRRVATETPDDDGEEDPGSVISQMARSRGQVR